MTRRPHPYPMTESFFVLRDEDLRRLAISRCQKQFDNDENQRMKDWLRENADVLLNAGTPKTSPEGHR